MKHIVFISALCITIILFSCSYYHNEGTSKLTSFETEKEYGIEAEYPEQNTGKVERYMNEKIGDKNNISFTNAVIDAELTLDDGTKIYVVNKPGTLKINLEKDQNSHASYEDIKSLGEGLKSFLNTPEQ